MEFVPVSTRMVAKLFPASTRAPSLSLKPGVSARYISPSCLYFYGKFKRVAVTFLVADFVDALAINYRCYYFNATVGSKVLNPFTPVTSYS